MTQQDTPADRAFAALMEAEITVEKMLGVIRRATDPESEHLNNEQMVAELKAQERRTRMDRMLDAMGDDGSAALDAELAKRKVA